MKAIRAGGASAERRECRTARHENDDTSVRACVDHVGPAVQPLTDAGIAALEDQTRAVARAARS
jgi:hypothetical protein